MTTASTSIDDESLERALGVVLVHHLGTGDALGADLLVALMGLMREFGLALEPAVGGALRALATLQSTLELLAPGFDLLGEAKSYGQTLANPFPSSGQSSPRQQLEALLPSLLPTLAALPVRLDRVLGTIERNDISVGVHLFPSDLHRQFVNQLVAQLVVTAVAAAFGMIGGLLMLTANGRLGTDAGRIVQATGAGCLGLGVLVLLSVLVCALRSRRERL